MFGKNPILSTKKGDGNSLDIHKIFATFQGEGPFSGHPAIFIRLSGCNLACDFCDTDFDDFNNLSVDLIIDHVKGLAENKEQKRIANLVVITGGEPLRQPIEKLCQKLIANNFQVQIETNGTLFRNLPKEVFIVCSPKNLGNGYKNIRADLLKRVNAFKFLVSASNKDYKEVTEVGQSKFNIPTYLQPLDEYDGKKNHENMQLVLKLAKKYGYIISLQTHKILGTE